jgi:hypothetical protein
MATPVSAAQEVVSYKPPVWAVSRMGCLAGEHFTPQPDGTLKSPAGFPLYPQERRPERDGSVRVIYAARIGHCRPCPRREECQGYGAATKKPRRVSACSGHATPPRRSHFPRFHFLPRTPFSGETGSAVFSDERWSSSFTISVSILNSLKRLHRLSLRQSD